MTKKSTVLSVDLDFKNALKASQDFTSNLEESLSKALKQNRLFTQLVGNIKKVDDAHTRLHAKQEKFQKDEATREKIQNGDLLKEYKKQEKELAKIAFQKEHNTKLSASELKRLKDETAELEAQSKLTDESLKKSEEELRQLRASVDLLSQRNSLTDEELEDLKEKGAELTEQQKITGEILKDTRKFLKSHEQLRAVIEGETKDLKNFSRDLLASASAAEEIRESLAGLADPSKLFDKLEGGSERLGAAFKDGIDVQSLSQDLGKGVGSAISKATKALSGGSGAIMAVGGVVGGVVVALGALLAAFIAVDKKVKEFNKDTVRTHGALSVMRLGAGNLNDGLKIVKHTVQDLSGNLGVTEDEAKQLFASLDNGNITLARITGGTHDAAEAQRLLSASLRDTYTAANMTGVSLSEYADNLTNYVNDLGMSTETVNDNFRSIAKMASESGFSTRRFYSMVVQATSGQSALNVSLEHTGELLLRMSKIMGMKKAAEMVGGAAGGMGQMSAQERLKTLLIAGKRGGDIYQRQAVQSASTFSQANRGLSKAFTDALERANLTDRGIGEAFSNSNPRNLVQSLSRLSATDQRKMITELRNSGVQGTEEMARQLDEITNLSRGDLGSRVGAGGALGAGANLQMQASLIRRLMDPSGRLSAPQRIAAESVTGMGGPQMDAFLSQMQAMTGDFEAMQRGGATGERLQGVYGLQKINGELVDQLGHVIRTADDLFMTGHGQQQHEESRVRDEATQIAYQTMEATVSVADILENKVAQYIQNVYEVLAKQLLPLLYKLPWLQEGANQFKQQQSVADSISKTIEEITSRQNARVRQMGDAELASRSAATPEERAAAKQRLDSLRQAQTNDSARINALRAGRSRVMSGEQALTQTTTVRNGADNALLDDPGVINRVLGSVMDRVSPTSEVTRNLSASEVTAQIYRQAGVSGPTNAEVSGFGAVSPATASPTTTPTAAQAPPVPTQAHAEAATAPVVAAQSDAQANATEISQREIREGRARERREAVNQEKLLKSKSLGDALAESKLPDAIAEADAKMRLLEGIYANGASSLSPDAINRLLSGEGTDTDIGQAGMGGAAARALRFRHATQAAEVHDFISQDRGGRTVITPIDRADQVMGMKPGGPVATAGTRGGGGNVNINIHGGDERRVFNVVRRAIQQAGITPSRVPGGG